MVIVMKVSTAIKLLIALMEKHGDIECWTDNFRGDHNSWQVAYEPITEIYEDDGVIKIN